MFSLSESGASALNQHASEPKISCLHLVGSKILAAKHVVLFLLGSRNLYMVKQRNRLANLAFNRYLLTLMSSTNPAFNNNGYLKANALIKQAKQVFTMAQGPYILWAPVKNYCEPGISPPEPVSSCDFRNQAVKPKRTSCTAIQTPYKYNSFIRRLEHYCKSKEP